MEVLVVESEPGAAARDTALERVALGSTTMGVPVIPLGDG